MRRASSGRYPLARISALCLATAATVLACQRRLPKPVPPAIEPSSARIVAEGDSSAVRRALVRSITRFQDAWRDAWQRAEVARHGALAFHFLRPDLEAGYYSPEVRRYQAIYCYSGWQGALAAGPPPSEPLISDPRRQPGRMSSAELDQFRARAQSQERLRAQHLGRIRGERDKGTICPGWTPPGDDLPLDEGPNLDLGLMVGSRARLRRERDSLLSRLEHAARRFPRDGWITGQRVRFLLDQQMPKQALAIADTCEAGADWCASLRGLALERLAEMARAEQAFASANATRVTPADDPDCGEPFVLSLLDDESRRQLGALDCSARAAALDTLWWLADPLWSDDGNDRFVAHHARQVGIALRAAVDRDERYSWRSESSGEAMREVVARYGWPSHSYWGGRFLDDSVSNNREAVRKLPDAPYPALEYSPDRSTFLPSWHVLASPFDASADAWVIERPEAQSIDDWWPREHMRREVAVRPMPAGQLALLRRDTALLVAVGVDDATPDHLRYPDERPRASLIAAFGPRRQSVLDVRAAAIDSTLRLHGHVRFEPFVLGVEVASRVPQEPARRMRMGVRPPDQLRANEVALSAPLLLHTPQFAANRALTPDDAITHLAGSYEVTRGRPTTVYWESYGFEPGDSLAVSVELVRDERGGMARRLGAALGVAQNLRDSVSVRWLEPDVGRSVHIVPTVTPTVARAVTLDLRNVPPGQYILRLQIRHADGRVATSAQSIALRE